MHLIELTIPTLLAYLIGSISSAILVCKMMRLPDPRTQGSRNPGATNVLRLGGKKAAIITLLGDLLKGLVPVLITVELGCSSTLVALVAFAAFLGHLYPIYFRFEGGKGVATALGCILALSWPVGLAWVATWLIMALIFRYSSLASLIATILTPFYMWYFTGNLIYIGTLAVMAIILVVRHRPNIKKLLAGKEHKIGRKIQ